jgi:predicted O-methyltransferase YrrM
MSQDLYSAVDNFLSTALIPPDPILDSALKSHEAAALPAIAVTPAFGKFLNLMARMVDAKNILEIGTLGGYSTIWLARALPPGGRLVTLELDPRRAEVARKNFQHAKLENSIEIRIGRALELLPQIAAANSAPFDLIFIDADKQNNPQYFQWALKLARPGAIIIVDNVVRDGAVVDSESGSADIQGIRKLLADLANEPRVSATAIQTVDAKGHDGFALALVL